MSVIQDGSEVGPATPTVPLATPTVPLAPPPKRHAHQTPDQADMCHAHSKSSAKGYGANPFQTPDLFDELSELEAYEEEQDAEPEDQPQQYQLRTGGGGGRGLGSHDYPDSPLSMIPEEDLEGMDSYNSSQRSHDRSLDPSPVPELKQGSGLGIRIITPPPRSPKGEGQKGVEHHVSSSEQVPWYQEASNQEVWQTTPAYRPDGEGEWSGKTTPTYHPEGEGAGQGTEENQRRLSSVQKLLVTEAVVPVLQVSSLCKIPVLQVRSLCKIPVLQVSSLCKMPVLQVSSLCKMPVLQVSSLCKMPVLQVNSLCKMPVLQVNSLCKMPVLQVNSLCKMPVLQVNSLCKMPVL